MIGLRCVAAVVTGPDGEAIAALSVSGLAARMTREKVTRCANLVIQTAADLSGRTAL